MNASRDDVLRRLAYIEGHVRGIRKMVEDDAYCVDLLKQTYAVKRAIDKLETVLVRAHLESCVPEGFSEGRGEAMVGELTELFELSRR